MKCGLEVKTKLDCLNGAPIRIVTTGVCFWLSVEDAECLIEQLSAALKEVRDD